MDLGDFALEDLGDHPQRGRVADLDQRIAAGLRDRADGGMARDHGAVDRRAQHDGRAAAAAEDRHGGLRARELGLALAQLGLRGDPLAVDADARRGHRVLARDLVGRGVVLGGRGGELGARRGGIGRRDRHQRSSDLDPIAGLDVDGGDAPGDRQVDLRDRAIAECDPRRRQHHRR